MINLRLGDDGSAVLDGEDVTPQEGMNAEATSINLIAGLSRERRVPLDVRLEDPHGGVSFHRIDGTRDPFTLVTIPDPSIAIPEPPKSPPQMDAAPQHDLDLDPDFDTQEIVTPQVEVRGNAWNDLFGDSSSIPSSEAISAERSRRKRSRRRAQIVIASAAAVILLSAGGVWAASQLNGGPSNEDVVSQQIDSKGIAMQQSVGRSDLPGYSKQPRWELDIDPKSAFTAYDSGLVEVSPEKITIYNPGTGDKIRSLDNDNPDLDFLIETTISGEPSVAWKVDDTIFAWNRDMGKDKKIIKAKLGSDASVSDSGAGLLVINDGEVFTLEKSGLERIRTPNGVDDNPLTYDGDNLVYSGWSGPIKVAKPGGGQISSAEIEAPFGDAEIIKWVSVGHGYAVLGWRSEKNGVFVTLNDVDTGKITSQAALDEDYLKNAKWVRGQGFETAVLGPLVFNLQSGELLADGSKHNISFTQAKGTFAIARNSRGAILSQSGKAWETSLELLGVMEDGGAILRPGKDKIISVGKE